MTLEPALSARKPAELRQGRGTTDLQVVQGGRLPTPTPPKGWLKVSRDEWETFWGSEVATAVRPEDMSTLERLFSLRDERHRAYRAVQKHGRLVEGSQGQLVLNPLLRAIQSIDAELRQLEDRFGMTPKSRVQLGISFTEHAKGLSAMNRMLEADVDESDPFSS